MALDSLIQLLAFLVTILITEMLENIFLLEYSGGKFKLRFHSGNLNPFISRDKTLIIWAIQLVIAGLLSIPLGKYFQHFIAINEAYYIPIFSLVGISFIVFGGRILGIRMSKNMWWAIVILALIFFIVLYGLSSGDFGQFNPLRI